MIYTFNVRDNTIWSMIHGLMRPTPEAFYREVQFHFEEFRLSLLQRGVIYEKLHKALVPVRDAKKRELLLMFDTNLFSGCGDYAEHVLKLLLPLLRHESAHSVLVGDFVLDRQYQRRAYELTQACVKWEKETVWLDSSQYFFIVLNNMTQAQEEEVRRALCGEPMYVGYGNFSVESSLKDALAYMLSSVCVLYKNKILFPAEEGAAFYSFGKKGYEEIPVSEEYYYSFLSYKIESSLVDEEDISLSLNSVCPFYVDWDTVTVRVEEEKLGYLLINKAKIMKRSGLEAFGARDLERLLQRKLHRNYIYDLQWNSYGDIMFNISFEVFCQENRYRILAGFKYLPRENEISLVTLF